MLAKYPGSCPQCGGLVIPGETILRVGKEGPWVHEGCLAAATASGTPARGARATREAMTAPTGAVEVFTDGACRHNPGPGGWAWARDEDHWASGGEAVSTNQRMEIRAAYEALLAHPGPLVVVSDSTYVVNCFRDGWWQGWRRRGWVNAAKKPVANRDLWEPFVDAYAARIGTDAAVSFRWVKGHSGDRMNDLVDRLAVAASHAVETSG